MKNLLKLKTVLILSFLIIFTFTNFIQAFPLFSNTSTITYDNPTSQIKTDSNTGLADGGSLYQQDIIGCLGNPQLNNPIYPSYTLPALPPDPSIYAYTFLISNSTGAIILNLGTPNLSTLPPGEYVVCGLSYKLEDAALLNTTFGQTVIDLQAAFDNQTAAFCGDTSDDCFNLFIEIPPPPIMIDTTACLGDIIYLPDGSTCVSPSICDCFIDIGTGCLQEKIYIVTPDLPTAETIDLTICEGECVTIGGFDCCEPSQIITLQNQVGCDSILTINIDFISENSLIIDTMACAGTMVTLPNGSLCPAGNTCSYSVDIGVACVQNITYFVAPLFVTTETIDVTLCEGECITIEGVDYCESIQEILLESTTGCDSTLILNIAFEGISAEITQTIAVSCFDEANGQAALSVNPDENYSFLWDNGETTSSVDNLSSGNHTVIVSSSLGCEKILSFFIESPTELTTVASVVQNVDCFGASTGIANVEMSGGTPGYSITWNNGEQGDTAINLSEGIQTYLVSDAQACMTEGQVVITQPQELSISISSTNSQNQDNNGTATVNIEGGTSPYSVQWNTIPEQSGLVAIDLSPGEYIATVIDDNGCTQTIEVSVELTTSLSDDTTFDAFSIFPNPTKDWLRFELNLEKSDLIKWELRNLLGQIILKESLSMPSNRMQQEINLSEYAGNLFFLTIFVGDKSKTYKVIKLEK